MSCATTTQSICQNPGCLDLYFVHGDDFAFTITFPFDISGHTVSAKIGDTNFTSAKISNTKITLSLTDSQTQNIANHATWYLKLTKSGITRTYIQGKHIQSIC